MQHPNQDQHASPKFICSSQYKLLKDGVNQICYLPNELEVLAITWQFLQF
jgi:hypothetical protein